MAAWIFKHALAYLLRHPENIEAIGDIAVKFAVKGAIDALQKLHTSGVVPVK